MGSTARDRRDRQSARRRRADDARQIRAVLEKARVPTTGQAMVHVLFRATLDGLIVRGPMIGGEQAFALVADWLSERPKIDRDRALAELARRYLTGHGPADDRDCSDHSTRCCSDGAPADSCSTARRRSLQPTESSKRSRWFADTPRAHGECPAARSSSNCGKSKAARRALRFGATHQPSRRIWRPAERTGPKRAPPLRALQVAQCRLQEARATSEAGLDRRRVAVPDLARSRANDVYFPCANGSRPRRWSRCCSGRPGAAAAGDADTLASPGRTRSSAEP